MYGNEMDFSTLVGKTLKEVKLVADDEIIFITLEGERFKLYHQQDCCEGVHVEDINGNLEDLVNSPILLAEESTSQDIINGKPEYPDSFTWTFYKLATIKGYVTIRWLGESNGYYSESVDFVKE